MATERMLWDLFLFVVTLLALAAVLLGSLWAFFAILVWAERRLS